MLPARFKEVTSRYPTLRVILLGDFCLDRYLEIDPALQETSIETKRPVHNVVRVRSQPGAAGTILNNLVALGLAEIHALGFCGDDGEGYELRRAMQVMPGVRLDHFQVTSKRRTFTYCKPLLMHPGTAPEELDRLDSKNWDPTPADLEDRIIASLRELSGNACAIIVLDQVDVAETGVVTTRVRDALGELCEAHPGLPVLADSRRGLRGWPPMGYKMNAAELLAMTNSDAALALENIENEAINLAQQNQQPVIVTLAEAGVVGALPNGVCERVPSLPVRGPIDIVGAGDAVMANLTAATASGATLRESLELAMAAANVVVHQLGTTGTANVEQLRSTLWP